MLQLFLMHFLCHILLLIIKDSKNFQSLYYIYFHRLSPQAICTSQKKSFCSGAHVEASVNFNPVKNHIAAGFSPLRSEAKPLASNQSLKKHMFSVGALIARTDQDVSDATLTSDDKIGVLLLNLGGPETLEDVQPFLFNLFADPVIL